MFIHNFEKGVQVSFTKKISCNVTNGEYPTGGQLMQKLSSIKRHRSRRLMSSAFRRNLRSVDRSMNFPRKVASSSARKRGSVPSCARNPNLKAARLRNRACGFSRKTSVRKASYWIVRVPWRLWRPVPAHSSRICTPPWNRRPSAAADHRRCRCRLRRHPPAVVAARIA